jgi:hypothetical protein
MADKLKPGAKNGFAEKLPEIKRRITDVNRNKEKSSEYVGLAGKATKDACDANNLNKQAFTFVAGCHRKEAAEAMDRVLTVFALALGTGLLDQMDMFDERLSFIRSELDARVDADATRKPTAGAKTVASLASVN